MKPTVEALDRGQLDLMWSFLQMGHQKANIPALKDLCDQLRQAMIQKTAGQRNDDPKQYVPFANIGTIVNSIVIETMCLYLSGELDRLERTRWIRPEEDQPKPLESVLICRPKRTRNDPLTVDLGYLRPDGTWRVHGTPLNRIRGWMPCPAPMEDE